MLGFTCPLESINPISSKTKGDQQEYNADLLCIYYALQLVYFKGLGGFDPKCTLDKCIGDPLDRHRIKPDKHTLIFLCRFNKQVRANGI